MDHYERIKAPVKAGDTATKMFQLLKRVCGDDAPCQPIAFRLFEEYKEAARTSTKRNPGSGGQIAAHTPGWVRLRCPHIDIDGFRLHVRVSPSGSLFVTSRNRAATSPPKRMGFVQLVHSTEGPGQWIPVEVMDQEGRIWTWKFQAISSFHQWVNPEKANFFSLCNMLPWSVGLPLNTVAPKWAAWRWTSVRNIVPKDHIYVFYIETLPQNDPVQGMRWCHAYGENLRLLQTCSNLLYFRNIVMLTQALEACCVNVAPLRWVW